MGYKKPFCVRKLHFLLEKAYIKRLGFLFLSYFRHQGGLSFESFIRMHNGLENFKKFLGQKNSWNFNKIKDSGFFIIFNEFFLSEHFKIFWFFCEIWRGSSKKIRNRIVLQIEFYFYNYIFIDFVFFYYYYNLMLFWKSYIIKYQ